VEKGENLLKKITRKCKTTGQAFSFHCFSFICCVLGWHCFTIFFKGATFVSLTGFFSPWLFWIFLTPPPIPFFNRSDWRAAVRQQKTSITVSGRSAKKYPKKIRHGAILQLNQIIEINKLLS